MSSRLINVRLDDQRLRKVKSLRESGVAVSDLVREAIDQKYAQVAGTRKPRDVEAIMNRLFEQYPDPPNLPKPEYNVHDRREAREFIIRHLEAKHRRNTEWYLKAKSAKSKKKRSGKREGKSR